MLSARTETALRAQAARLLSHLAESAVPEADVAASLATTRAAMAHRAVVVAADPRPALTALTAGDVAPDLVMDSAVTNARTVFVFPGQGSQWTGMAVGLAEDFPVFADSLRECAAALADHVDWDLMAVLSDEQALRRVDVVQPALFAVMVSLAALWRSFGVRPDAVIGHSQGEIAAACVAGALSIEDAARVVALRSRALAELTGRGGMVSVALSREDVGDLLGDRLGIAAVNGPGSVVVSGDSDALDVLLADCERAGVRARRVPVDYASHSDHVEAIREHLLAALAPIRPKQPEVPMFSTVTGDWLDTTGLDAAYWYRNLRETVLFGPAVGTLLELGHTVFAEVSPHPVLTVGVQESIDATARDAVVTGSLRRDDGRAPRFVAGLAEAWAHGAPVDWSRAFGPEVRRVELPTYPFEHRRYWIDPVTPTGSRLDDWRYRIAWRAVDPTTAKPVSGRWFVVARPEDAGQDLVAGVLAALTAAGAAPVLVGPAEITGALVEDVAGVVSLLAVDESPEADHPVVPAGLAATLELTRAVHASGRRTPVWLLTRNAVATGHRDTAIRPAQAQIWGLGRVVGLEHPEFWGGLVDLPAEWDEDVADRLCAVLGGIGDEDQVAVRGAGVFVRRLVRAPLDDVRAGTGWRPSGTVLVTGGTGALGSQVARWAARHGAEHLVLVSRSGQRAPKAAQVAAEVAALGARASVVACDVTDRATLAAVMAEHTPTAVFHTAGVGQLTPLSQTTVDELAAVVGAKVAGASVLDELAGPEVEAFVLFSSNAGVWGSGGQGAYAAGNAFLDALAERRRARGLAGTSVAWGSWSGAGIAAEDGAAAHLRAHGIRPMDPEAAVAALGQVLDRDETVTAIADVDWSVFVPAFTARRTRPLIADLPEANQISEPAGPAEPVPSDLSEQDWLDLVHAHAAAVLGLTERVPADRALRELGLDSLTAVRLRNRLVSATGLTLPTTVVFDHPTVAELAGFLRARALGVDARPAVAATTVDPGEPIAIVAMSCRYPGGADSPEDLWRLVEQGRETVSEFPADRGFDLDAIYDPDPDRPGATYVRTGSFVQDVGHFDAGLFGISPREALAMDPQQRLLLEASWELFERAGIDPSSLRGSRTGVFAGAQSQGYGVGEAASGAEGYQLTGGATAVVSGRVAYAFGLQGPAITVDTACSSSLVAMHLAAQALRQDECSLAVVGGVAVVVGPTAFVEFSRQRGLAPDGRCKPFAAAADGTAWGEGVGAVLLERLSDAERNGHEILAVIRGSAVNSDGASNGLSAPSGHAQQRVIRAALAAAGLTGADVDVVEAHGTGTTLGDPIEAEALLATYGQDRDRPLWLGSVKSNIGHTAAASGMAGVLKMVLAMRHGTLPATLHVDEPTPNADWTAGSVSLLTEARPWPDGPRRAGVSSFGVSGTNAHVIIEAPPAAPAAPTRDVAARSALPWLLSGADEQAVREQAARLRSAVDLGAADVAHTLVTARAALDHRAVVVAADRDGFLRGLDDIAGGGGSIGTPVPGRLAFLFSGQGSQRVGMGRRLHAEFPVFAAAFDEVCAGLATDVPLRDVVFGGEPELLDRTAYSQAGLFALEVALFRLVESWGVRPDVLVGHSIGELAAAHVAGVLSIEDACTLVSARGRLMQALPEGGAMVAITATPAEIAPALTDVVCLAAVNGPSSVVISGEESAVLAEAGRWAAMGRRTRRLTVSHAFHSSLMAPMLDEFLAVAATLTFHEPRIPIVSTVSGALQQEYSAQYWVDHVRRPVLFHDGVLAAGAVTMLELGPDGVLTALGQDTAPDAELVSALRANTAEVETITAAVGRLHSRGHAVDWRAVLAGTGGATVPLPTYPFQRRRYWLAPGPAHATGPGMRQAEHPLLDGVLPMPDDGVELVGLLSTRTRPWLADHAVRDTVLLPGTAFVDLALRAGEEGGCDRIEELVIEAPLVLAGAVHLRVSLGAADEHGHRTVAVHSRPDERDGDPWTRHATGTVTPARPVQAAADTIWPPAGAAPLDTSGVYEDLAARGYHYGPAFVGLRTAWRRGDEVFAEVELPDGAGEVDDFLLHPALTDAALHAMGFGPLADEDGTRLPFLWRGVTVSASGATALRVAITVTGADEVSVRLADPAGAPVATVDSLLLRTIREDQLTAATDPLRCLEWRPAPADGPAVDGDLVVEEITGFPDVRGATSHALALVRAALADETPTQVLVTRGATGHAPDLPGAAVWGLVRSVQAEHPGRFVLLDTDTDDWRTTEAAVRVAIGAGESQLAVRDGELLVPAVVPVTDELAVPDGGDWRLTRTPGGTADSLVLAARPLGEPGPGQVRVAVRAAGLNFRDALITLGMYPGEAPLGSEGAGVVVATGPGVTGIAPGERVMGLFTDGFGPFATADHRLLAPVPPGWSFTEAAAVPVAFCTAYHALVDLAELRAGQTVLVHAGAGGVGMAAVQLAHHLGAEVFATASPGKWDTLRGLGLDDEHIASSRTTDFAPAFLAATGGRGVDVVLNALAGEYVDASLRVLSPGGRFVEMGKTDLRDPDHVAATHDVAYRAFDLLDAGQDRVGEILRIVLGLLEDGRVVPLPVSTWDIRRAREAVRHLAAAKHVGKLVLTVPAPIDPAGTVVVTGASGVLGGLVARHLVERHGVRDLLLLARGPVPGQLRDDLTLAGARVTATVCDVADRDALARAIAGRRLTAVVHAAGVLDDGVVESMTPDRIDAVLRPKLDAARWLHELTEDQDLAAFVLFSSAAATLGNPGQANYTAANAAMDALAACRHDLGLPARSLAWGPWAGGGMADALGAADRRRMARAGLAPLTEEQGLAMLDAALHRSEPVLLALRQTGRADSPLLRDRGRRVRRTAAPPPAGLVGQLAGLAGPARERVVLAAVRREVAAVLGFESVEQVTAGQSFEKLGLDSLTGVELRNRLHTATGLRLPATLVFDLPTAEELTRYLVTEMSPAAESGEKSVTVEIERLEKMLRELSADSVESARVGIRLRKLAAVWEARERGAGDDVDDGADHAVSASADLESATDDELFDLIREELGR
ncbi:MAG TPA: SDR family NAD(P)-dependent oxidoreductase [Actinophytocola sp.]|nr:SDR family NAD(P)-dependent oxidoreductase [Actinophytocola sp.]HYQ64245.1 SDR family NAD(P)-dependent oxidoreductase [Actinophytocola sp.]